MRAALRALGWVVAEVIPWQAVRVVFDRDFQARMDQAAYAHDCEMGLNEFAPPRDGLDGGELPDYPGPAATYSIEDVFAERDRLWDERPDPMEMFDRIRAEADGILGPEADHEEALRRNADSQSTMEKCGQEIKALTSEPRPHVTFHVPVRDYHPVSPATSAHRVDGASPAGAPPPEAPAGPPNEAWERLRRNPETLARVQQAETNLDDAVALETVEITMHRSELVPGGNGAFIAYSDDFPGKQFLIFPK